MTALPIPESSRPIAASSRKRRRTCGRGVDATTVEHVGHPAAAILDAARDGADLVVIGSRHRGLIKRLLFGSVSAEVVVEAPCDVLVAR